jgi:HlyD family secretion protein
MKVSRKFLIIFGIILILIIAYILYSQFKTEDKLNNYNFAEVKRGNIEFTISSTGSLSPVTTVDVGTQVSGIIDSVYVDFNDKVRAGHILAVLDTFLLKTVILDAESGLERAEAQLEEAQADYERNLSLFEQGLIPESTMLPYRINLKTQKANLKSAQATLQRAQRNLKYAVITSPIKGTVIARNVEAGQTVAASFSTPTLFQIAEDLSHMEILVDVDESDIGEIKEGQKARFSVQAFPDMVFSGKVKQIRLQPKTVSNVVTYTVVVEASNEENLLLPGMTATVDFVIAHREDALLVPNTALRFKPSEELLAEFRQSGSKGHKAPADSNRMASTKSQSRASGEIDRKEKFENLDSRSSPEQNLLWFLNDKGKLKAEVVKIGITDGTNTEIIRATAIKEGMRVITGYSLPKEEKISSKKKSNSNIGMRPGMGPPGPRGF